MEFSRPLTAAENRQSREASKKVRRSHLKHGGAAGQLAARGRRLAGTQALDRTWGVLKQYLPRALPALSTSGQTTNARVMRYVYRFQFRRNCYHKSNASLFKALGKLLASRVSSTLLKSIVLESE